MVAAAFAELNVTPLGPLVALQVYVSVDVEESSVAEPSAIEEALLPARARAGSATARAALTAVGSRSASNQPPPASNGKSANNMMRASLIAEILSNVAPQRTT